ncbi:MAG: DUF1570 domain-containing protein [Planctomycetia bacterium]|nr:DUF1570 domain-containing protein [Planctomycetia bacterium]
MKIFTNRKFRRISRIKSVLLFGIGFLFFLCFIRSTLAVVHIEVLNKDPKPSTEQSDDRIVISGRLIADYRTEEGGLAAVEDKFGKIHVIRAEEILKFSEDNLAFAPESRKAMETELLREFGEGFRAWSSDHFIFIYNTSDGYVRWNGKLFESLYDAFERYQARKGLNLKSPDVPMIVILFASKKEFLDFAQKDAPGASNIVAYYHRLNNRTVLYDLSEVESEIPEKKKSSRSFQKVDAILSRPQAAFNVATIVHEATHQISFNRGMFLRPGPFSLWLSEGVSMYFEVPDSNSSRGWSHRGVSDKPNFYRLKIFRNSRAAHIREPIQNLIKEIDYMKDVQYSYAASWALFFFLNEKAPKKLVKYMEFLNKKPPFTVYSPEERLADFEKFFGNDWNGFYRNFDRFFQNLR